GGNSGLVDPHNVEVALKGCHQYLLKKFSEHENWILLREVIERFFRNYIVSHCLAMDQYFAITGNKSERKKLQETLKVIESLPFMTGISFQYNWPRLALIIRKSRLVCHQMSYLFLRMLRSVF
ncbi:MAG: hypothetical protein KGQ58_06840, partial [Proteobacteria bacterium]|nr:hypothetical protein [Pseudomonadota bacterium]